MAQRVRSRHGKHAHFTPDESRRILDEATIGIFLSTFETHGWLFSKPGRWTCRRWSGIHRGRPSDAAARSSPDLRPYLTPATGRIWRAIDELEPALRSALADRAAFQPRAWVLSHMTDAICSAALFEIIRESAARPRRFRCPASS